jgi:pilus assembly protein Flp/PilA
MRQLFSCVRRALIDTKAATAVEYGLIISLVVLAIVAAITGVADANTGMWDDVSEQSEEAMRTTDQ